MNDRILSDADLDKIQAEYMLFATFHQETVDMLIRELRHAREVIREMIDPGEFPFYSVDHIRECAKATDSDGYSLMAPEAKAILRALGESIE